MSPRSARDRCIHIRVAGIVVADREVLIQRNTYGLDRCFAFLGGHYEVGDTFESRLREEFEEETNARVTRAELLSVLERRLMGPDGLWQALEIYMDAETDRRELASREAHLSQHWLPLSAFATYDVRPHVVRDMVASGEYRSLRHLALPVEAGWWGKR